ncbi:MAG: type I-E CRISPR-associated protein Cse2/CasB [Chloroflexota bacterium]|nr:MAG: hypothetical protein DLM70_06465 [Chloroflexota bacterium]
MNGPTEHVHRFAAYLQRFVEVDNRAALAALRRGLGKTLGEAPEMFPYIVPWIRTEASWRVEESYYLVASLFAMHGGEGFLPAHEGRRNLGASVALVKRAGSESIEARFVAMGVIRVRRLRRVHLGRCPHARGVIP